MYSCSKHDSPPTANPVIGHNILYCTSANKPIIADFNLSSNSFSWLKLSHSGLEGPVFYSLERTDFGLVVVSSSKIACANQAVLCRLFPIQPDLVVVNFGFTARTCAPGQKRRITIDLGIDRSVVFRQEEFQWPCASGILGSGNTGASRPGHLNPFPAHSLRVSIRS